MKKLTFISALMAILFVTIFSLLSFKGKPLTVDNAAVIEIEVSQDELIRREKLKIDVCASAIDVNLAEAKTNQ